MALRLSRLPAFLIVVTLTAPASPALAQQILSVGPAAVSADASVRITGTGFAATAAQHEVTFTPATGGPTLAGVITAVSAADSIGARRLTVTVPRGLPATRAVITVRNLETGAVIEGASAEIVAIVPSVRAASPGTSLPLTIALVGNADYSGGSLRLTMGSGISVSGVSASGPTLSATVTVAASAALGPRTITITTSTMSVVMPGGFSVVAPGNQPPVAAITSPAAAAVGQSVTFSAAGSTDPDGDALTYAWTFSDGPTASGVTTARTFAAAGSVTVTLTVDDGRGGTATDSVVLTITPRPTVNRPPTAIITGPLAGIAGAELVFDGRGSVDPDDDSLAFSWTLGGDGLTATTPTASATFAAAGTYTISLIVTDTGGLSASTSQQVEISDPTDVAPPVVSLDGPTRALPGADVTFVALVSDNVGVERVRFLVDGTNESVAAIAPYARTFALPAVAALNQQVVVSAIAEDAAGNTASATATLVISTVADTEPPVVSLRLPETTAPGATLRLVAQATDDSGVAQVEFAVDAVVVGQVTTRPYEVVWAVPADAVPGSTLAVVARARDAAGNEGAGSGAVVVAADTDTTPPEVELSAPETVLAGQRLDLSAVVTDAGGVARVVFDVGGADLPALVAPPFTASTTAAPGAVPGSALAVRATATDFAGNTGQASRLVRVVDVATTARGAVAGEVYDDTTGLPLAGATVVLAGTDSLGRPYDASSVTDVRGRYVLRAPTGDGVVRITLAGWTRVDRPVSVRGASAFEPLDARLTPTAAMPAMVSPVLGGTVSAAGGALVVPAGTLTEAAALSLVALGPQGLQGRLPYGWSPAAAVDVSPHGVTFAGAALLRASNVFGLPAGTPLVVARFDEALGGWRTVGTTSVDSSGNAIEVAITASGQFAFLLADELPVAPPPPVAGLPLEGVAVPVLPDSAAAEVVADPRVVFYRPGVQSNVVVGIGYSTALTSGAAVVARVSERYRFQSGAVLTGQPFVQDLVLFQIGNGATPARRGYGQMLVQLGTGQVRLATRTVVTPSRVFEPVTLREGLITVEMFAPAAAATGPALVAPEGAQVDGPDGTALLVPFGAVTEPTPIALRGVVPAALGVDLPPDVEVLAGVDIDFTGTLARAARISMPTSLADGRGTLLVQVIDVAGRTHLVMRGLGVVAGGRLVSTLELDGLPLPLDGVTTGGRYLFVRVSAPIGFVGGIVRDPVGALLSAAVVSTPNMPIVGLSRIDGAYAAPARTGAQPVTATNVATGDVGVATADIVADALVPLDLAVTLQPPRVTSISPADGAANVALSAPVVVAFSKPIRPDTLTGAVERLVVAAESGMTVAGTLALSHGDTVATFRASEPLVPNTRYVVSVAAGITDLSGTPLQAAVTSSFESLDTEPPPTPPAGSVAASVPVNGQTTVTATQGTATPRDTVSVLNLRTGAYTPVLVDPNGGFSVVVAAGPADALRLRILDQAGNETLVDLPGFRQVNADGSVSAAVGPDGGLVEGPEGTAAEIRPGTFPDGAVVTLKRLTAQAFPVQLPAETAPYFRLDGGLEIDFGGAVPTQYVNVMIPPVGGETADDRWVVVAVASDEGVPILTPVDTGRLRGDRIATSSPPCPGVTARGVYGFLRAQQPVGVNYGQTYAQGYGGLKVQAGFLLVSGSMPFPMPYSVIVAESPQPVCYPTLTGRVTVTPNQLRVTIAASELAPADREITVRNLTNGRESRLGRTVVGEYSAVLPGTVRDTLQAMAVQTGGGELFVPVAVRAGDAPGTVVVRADISTIRVPVASVRFRNASLRPAAELVVAADRTPFAASVAGVLGDNVEVVTAGDSGHRRVITNVVLGQTATVGTGPLVLRVERGTIDPNRAELDDAGVPGVARTEVRLTSLTGLDLVVPDAAIVEGGTSWAFDGALDDTYRLVVHYENGTIAETIVPRLQLVVANPKTGRVLRTITVQAPPRDEPVSFGTITDDVEPPRVISTPSFLANFDPSGTITFTFSEPMDARSLKEGLKVRDSQGRIVQGEVRVHDGNRRATFVPRSALRVAERYSVTLVGDDEVGRRLEPGQTSYVTDRGGNSIRTLSLRLSTYRPRVVGRTDEAVFRDAAAVQPYAFRDSRVVQHQVGDTLKTLVLGATGSRVFDKVVAVDATDAAAPTKAGNALNEEAAATRQRMIVLDDTRFRLKTGEFATGRLLVTTTYNSSYSFVTFYDARDPLHPEWLANKVLTANPASVTPFLRRGAVAAIGYARGLTALDTSDGPVVYSAVEGVGLMMTTVNANVPEVNADQRVLEPYYPGDFTDVGALGGRLVAIDRSDRRLDVLTPNFGPVSSVTLPEVPRRLLVVEGLAIDVDRDGEIRPGEQFDLAVVGTNSSVIFVDLRDPSNPQLLGRVPMPGIVRDLDIDVERLRLFVSGDSSENTAAPRSIYMVDLSDPSQVALVDRDDDGRDDRIVWSAQSEANGVRFDANRGLLYASTDTSLDIWAVYDACCDLGVETTARRADRPRGDRDALLRKEKDALALGIAAGLQRAETECGVATAALALIEQGSGACVWKPDPAASCSQNYQPGLSDHDFEVFFPQGTPAAAQACTIQALTAEFIDAETEEGRPIRLPNGGSMAFDDISFFPVAREEFDQALLNIDPPSGAGGSDTVGDMGLGRQQLLLKWLLEGERVEIPNVPLAPIDLGTVLERLKSTTGIPALEGYEWARLQAYAMAKGGSFLRVKGASDPQSSFYRRHIKQLHDVGKAGIRATLARMVADESARALVLDVTRERYATNACLAISPAVRVPARWTEKPCTSFEEYVASAAAKTLRGPTPLGLFTVSDIVDRVHRFYRVKSDLETISTEELADGFVASTARFIADVAAVTEPVWTVEVVTDPRRATRESNIQQAATRIAGALAGAKLHPVPEIFNRGFQRGEDLRVAMYHRTPGSGSAGLAREHRFVLDGGERRSLDYLRTPDGEEQTDPQGNALKYFEIGPVRQDQPTTTAGEVAFVIDLPDRRMKEAIRENNVGGFFYYVLDPQTGVAPPVAGLVPSLPSAVGNPDDLLRPDEQCYLAPALRVTQVIVVDGQEYTGDLSAGFGEVLTVRLKVENLSGEVARSVWACSSLNGQCYEAGDIGPGQVWRYEYQYTVPSTGVVLDLEADAYSEELGLFSAAAGRFTAACEAYQVIELDPNPNPAPEASTIGWGGHAVRYFRVVSRRTGQPVPNVDVVVQVTDDIINRHFHFTTNAQGIAVSPGFEGLAIRFDEPGMITGRTYRLRVVEVNGVAATCAPTQPQTTVTLVERQQTRSLARGAAIEGSLGAIISVGAGAETGLEIEYAEKVGSAGVPTTTAISISPSVQVAGKLGVEFSLFEAKVGGEIYSSGSSLFGIKSGVGASLAVSASRGLKWTIPTPLDPERKCVLAKLTLWSQGPANPLFTHLLDKLRSQTCDTRRYFAGDSFETAAESSGEASLGLSVGKLFSSGHDRQQKSVTFGFGATVGTGAKVSTSSETSYAWNAAGTGLRQSGTSEAYSLSQSIDWKVGVDTAIDDLKSEGRDDDADATKVEFEKWKQALKLGTGGSRAETYSLEFGYEFSETEPGPAATTVKVTYAGPKRSGWKATFGGPAASLAGPATGKRSYTFSDVQDVMRLADTLTNVGEIRLAEAALNPLQRITFEPTLLQEEHRRFTKLLFQTSPTFSDGESLSSGLAVPLAIGGKLFGLKLGGGVTLKADVKLGYTRRKGRVLSGRTWVLEDYDPSLFTPSTIELVSQAVVDAWDAVLSYYADTFSDVVRTVATSGTTEVRSNFTATMVIDGRLEPEAFEVNLFSYRYDLGAADPASDFRRLPGDTFGPAGEPHYGIGGFHHFGPEDYTLAVSTPLVIDYRDEEIAHVPGLVEGQLAIYRWDAERADWDHVGGVVDVAANTVTTPVQRFGLYTVGMPMPAGEVTFTVQDDGLSGPSDERRQRYTLTSSVIRTNTGAVVPDGTRFTVRAVTPPGALAQPFGTVVTLDVDPVRENVQVTSTGGVITFTVEYSAPDDVHPPGRAVVYAAPGTAFGEVILVKGQ